MNICKVHYYAKYTQLFDTFPLNKLIESNANRINFDLDKLLVFSNKHFLQVDSEKTAAQN